MTSAADIGLLALGILGFCVTAYLAFHYIAHRDRRRANRRAPRSGHRKGRRVEDR